MEFGLTGYERIKRLKAIDEIYYIHYYRCYKCNAVHINANSTPKSKNKGIHDQFVDVLKSINIEKKYRKAIELNLLKIVTSRSEELKNELRLDKKKVTELKTELEALEGRFAYGKIPENIYEKFSNKLEIQIIELEQKISNGKYTTVNLSKKIKIAIDKIQNLDELWVLGDYKHKKAIQKLLFSEGMVVGADNKQLRTDNINYLFYVMSCFSSRYTKEKKQTFNVKIEKSASVAPSRLELLSKV